MKSIEISARTVAEAIRLALAQLGKDRDEVAIEVLESGSEAEEALVRVTVVDDDEEPAQPERPQRTRQPLPEDVDVTARRTLEELLERMDIEAYVTAVRSTVPDQRGDPEETITLHVEGADEEAMSLLIGRRGETLRSVQ
ncbi:MAG TPA: Jag N-terminal domain-containing protein, partial [Roseiflexaceae bacterium]|nr:Jag N-terminal domain-containing protein [Roseiflexaceae bacterium]